jgi:hypothetical protein
MHTHMRETELKKEKESLNNVNNLSESGRKN